MPHRHGTHHHVHRHIVEDLSQPESLPLEHEPASTIPEPASVVRRAATGTSTCTGTSCGTSSSSGIVNTLPVVLGVVIPVVVAIAVLIFLHRRHVRKLRLEDAHDKHKSLDFGMEVVRSGGNTGPEMGEKPHKHGMSLDIIGSPYMLPPGLHNSKESLRSLSKVYNRDDDKYRLGLAAAAQSDNNSLYSYRSQPNKWGKDDASSLGGSTRHAVSPPDDMNQGLLKNASRMSRSPPVDTPFNASQTIHEEKLSEPEINGSQARYPEDTAHSSAEMPMSHEFPEPPARNNEMFFGSFGDQSPHQKGLDEESHTAQSGLSGFDFGTSHNNGTTNEHHDIPTIKETPAESRSAGLPRLSLPMSETSDYGDEPNQTMPASLNVSEAEDNKDHPRESEEIPPPRNNRMTKQFTNFDEGFDPHRLTVGIRPLPPEDPTDNAEQRANRIRSFYKEYFDDSKGGGAPEEYTEDFGPEFYEDPAVYDPYTGEYYMGPQKPFAQPVARRAMTPPPRFQGPPRTFLHPAAGSRAAGPRAFSSASGRLPARRGPSKPAPPPEPLHVLPSPHLIKDDMSVLPIDYAPGQTFKDRAEGRPESPHGGLRPFTSMSRAHSPLVSSFDDLAAIPSPHAMRKSGLYTTLDFAPPARFRNDTGSDAGSIRSNRTGISAVHEHNIRAGAYRVSRLPTDVVGTKDDLFASLRPTMDLVR